MDSAKQINPKNVNGLTTTLCKVRPHALAHNELYETKIERIAIFMCSKECQWQLFEVEEKEFTDWETKWALRLQEFYDPRINTNNEETIMANVVAQIKVRQGNP